MSQVEGTARQREWAWCIWETDRRLGAWRKGSEGESDWRWGPLSRSFGSGHSTTCITFHYCRKWQSKPGEQVGELFIHLFIHLFIYLLIYLFIYLKGWFKFFSSAYFLAPPSPLVGGRSQPEYLSVALRESKEEKTIDSSALRLHFPSSRWMECLSSLIALNKSRT